MNRREFLAAGLMAASGAGTVSGRGQRAAPEPEVKRAGIVLEEASLGQLQEAMESGALTSERLVALYLERIRLVDQAGPRLQAILELNPNAIAEARRRDEERRSPRGSRGPLHGIPVLLKDNIDTTAPMPTTAGSLALKDVVRARAAAVTERLIAAGAVVLGKSNLSEWANFRGHRSTSGWSAMGGLTRNPYVLDRNPSGSSSGSAVAVAANLCAVAVGTETNGSIISPSSANGIVGMKPTVGLISRTGIIPISESQDTAGPMGRTVADVAALLGALAGSDPEDAATSEADEKLRDYTQFLDASGLKGARIGVGRQFFKFHRLADPLMEAALVAMKDAGAELVDIAELTPRANFWASEGAVLRYEFKDGLNRYLAARAPDAPVKNLADLIAFNEKHREQELAYFGQELFLESEEKGPLTEPAYTQALAEIRRLTRAEGIDKAVRELRVEAIIAPSMGPSCTTDLLLGDRFVGGASWPAAAAGYPSITVPAGFVHGLPVGLLFFGPAYSEGILLRMAYAFEQATKHRKAPEFLPSIG